MSDSPVHAFLASHAAAGTFPGAVWLVGERGRVVEEGAVGGAALAPRPAPATRSTLYDLASLTKPLAAACLAVSLRAERRLELDDPLARHLPSWSRKDEGARLSLLDLATHRSGLPAWLPLYLHAGDGDREGRIGRLAGTPLLSRPGERVLYSCPGYILLGFALERAGGESLDRLFTERITRPLGIRDLLFRPPPRLRRRTAPTEAGNARERELAGDDAARYNGWRSAIIQGEVHDNNARTLTGVAGNAGLFGTARAVFALASAVLGPGKGFDEEGRRLLRVNLTPGLEEHRSVGFQVASTPGSSAGDALSRASFGHTGFTGTSLWIDPEPGRIYVLLTNRVHPRFRAFDMNGLRREFHRLAAAL